MVCIVTYNFSKYFVQAGAAGHDPIGRGSICSTKYNISCDNKCRKKHLITEKLNSQYYAQNACHSLTYSSLA